MKNSIKETRNRIKVLIEGRKTNVVIIKMVPIIKNYIDPHKYIDELRDEYKTFGY